MGGISVLFLMGIFLVMFSIFIAAFFVIVAYILLTYIFESIAVMRMSKNLGYKVSITAWIPFYNKYLLGKIADARVLGVILAINNIFVVAIGCYFYVQQNYGISLFGIFLLLLLFGFILNTVISNKIFKKTIEKFADILTIFSVLSVGLLRPIFLFAVRNSKELCE